MENGQTCPKACSKVKCLCTLLVVVGGLNWGLVGAFDFNLVEHLVGPWPVVEQAVYILVGVAALVLGGSKIAKKCNC